MHATITDIRLATVEPTEDRPSGYRTTIRGSLHELDYAELPLAHDQGTVLRELAEVMARARDLTAPALDEAEDGARAAAPRRGRGKAARIRAGHVVKAPSKAEVGECRVRVRIGEAVIATLEGDLVLATSADWQEVRWVLTVHKRVPTDDLTLIDIELDVERIGEQMELGLAPMTVGVTFVVAGDQ